MLQGRVPGVEYPLSTWKVETVARLSGEASAWGWGGGELSVVHTGDLKLSSLPRWSLNVQDGGW